MRARPEFRRSVPVLRGRATRFSISARSSVCRARWSCAASGTRTLDGPLSADSRMRANYSCNRSAVLPPPQDSRLPEHEARQRRIDPLGPHAVGQEHDTTPAQSWRARAAYWPYQTLQRAGLPSEVAYAVSGDTRDLTVDRSRPECQADDHSPTPSAAAPRHRVRRMAARSAACWRSLLRRAE